MNPKTYTAVRQHHTQLFMFWGLIVAIVSCVFLYGYFVSTTIFHTAERQRVADSIIDVKSAISQLELAIIEENRGVTKVYAHELGFTQSAAPVFVTRDPEVQVSLHESR